MTSSQTLDPHPAVVADLVNVYLNPVEAAALPVALELFYSSVQELDAIDPDNPFAPVVSARARLDIAPPYDNADSARQGLAWLAEILAFATRRPTGVWAYTTTATGVEGASWQGAGPMRFARRRGAPRLFRTTADLRTLVAQAMAASAKDLESSGLEHAVVWHNLARREAGTQYLDVRLLHQWIPLEVLAAQWAAVSGRARLLSDSKVSRLSRHIRAWASDEGLDDATISEMATKAAELKRRPAVSVLLEFIRAQLGPYSVQPLGADLEALVRRSIGARNQAVHQGAVDFGRMDGSSSASRDLHKIAGITERVILVMLGAQLPYLTEVPWTIWRSPS